MVLNVMITSMKIYKMLKTEEGIGGVVMRIYIIVNTEGGTEGDEDADDEEEARDDGGSDGCY